MTRVIVLLLAVLPMALANEEYVFNGDGCDQDQLFQQRFKPFFENNQQLSADINKIINHIVSQKPGQTYQQLSYFVDKFGPRMTGTQNLEDSIDFMLKWLQKEGHDNVRGEPVQVPKWTRGTEWARMTKPRTKQLNILGLGYSEGTNGQIIEAPVMVVRSFEELERNASQVSGKIVVYNFEYESYGKSYIYRSKGASRAAKHGAVAAMIRSLTPFSIDSPHTGMQTYDDNVTKIPAISITVEDAQFLQRLYNRNERIIIQLYSENHLHEQQVQSRNTISEVRGETNPEEIVLVSGHLDSWDVGQGAMDDGAGAFISWRALSIIKSLGLKVKRTIRSVLWTAEEVGLVGAQQYARQHHDELKDHVLAMESDIGTFTPRGLTYSGRNRTGQCVMWHIMQYMQPINATQLTISNEGSDVTVLAEQGVPIASLDTENDKYFYFHHTQADTMSVEQSEDLDKCQALWTSVAYALASIEHRLPY